MHAFQVGELVKLSHGVGLFRAGTVVQVDALSGNAWLRVRTAGSAPFDVHHLDLERP